MGSGRRPSGCCGRFCGSGVWTAGIDDLDYMAFRLDCGLRHAPSTPESKCYAPSVSNLAALAARGHVRWGIIGCGDVTEVKSGPAFNRVPDSSIAVVMRRDGAKAQDYAHRHGVPRWTTDADEVIGADDVDAV